MNPTKLSQIKPSLARMITEQALLASSRRRLDDFCQSHGWSGVLMTFRARRDEQAEQHKIEPSSVRETDLRGFFRAVTQSGAVIVFHGDSIEMEALP